MILRDAEKLQRPGLARIDGIVPFLVAKLEVARIIAEMAELGFLPIELIELPDGILEEVMQQLKRRPSHDGGSDGPPRNWSSSS